MALGSARVPRAIFGVAPKIPSHKIFRRKNQVGRGIRRDAQSRTRDACAPVPGLEFGLKKIRAVLTLKLFMRAQKIPDPFGKIREHAVHTKFAHRGDFRRTVDGINKNFQPAPMRVGHQFRRHAALAGID